MKKIKINYLLALLVMGSLVFTSCEKESCEKESEFIECAETCNHGNYKGHNNGCVQVCEGGDSLAQIDMIDTNFVECGPGLIGDTNVIIYCNGIACEESVNWMYTKQRVIQLYCENQEGASQIQTTRGVLSIGCGLISFNDHNELDIYKPQTYRYQEDLAAKTITWTNVSETRSSTEWRIILDQPNKRVLETIMKCDVDKYCKAEHVITMTLTR